MRNITIRTAAAFVCIANLPLLCRADDAQMFRVDAAHRGVYDSAPSPLRAVKWRFRTGGMIFASPSVADGVVYVGSADGKLYAVRAADGALVWKFATGGPVNSSPAVVNGVVYFASLDGNVYAVGAADGRRRWRYETEGERRFTAPGIHGMIPRTQLMPDPFDVFLSSPAVARGTVYIGSGDHFVYALDAASGALRWRVRTGNVVHASPAVSNGTVYIGSWDRYFYALDARTGAVRWKFQTGDDRNIYNQVGIAGSAAVDGGTVYFGCRDSFFYALDARTGALRWKQDQHGSWVIASPAISNGSVYFTTSDEKVFWALDAATGAPRFKVPYGAFSFSSPALAGDVAYFGTFDGRLYGVDVRSGTIVARYATDGSVRNLPSHLDARGSVDLNGFYPDETYEGIVVGLNRIYSLGSIPGSPALAGGVLFVGSTDGTLYAVD
ncbi:MAG TPA: PQQ-binding-like beta-propeller repeat protein [Candidatus Tumulicola sp.]|nr:PQQ-binding-like beta-propeller repeat protein [Candidatus Tumulicola sp.]